MKRYYSLKGSFLSILLAISITILARGILAIGPFTVDFDGPGSGTVLDASTGLIWTRCSGGQAAADCSGTSIQFSWSGALNYCNTITTASRSWRLPNMNELLSLMTYKQMSPATDSTVFLNIPADGLFWSSSSHVQSSNKNQAMIVEFMDGGSDSDTKTNSHHVRCVSGP
ncbi:hypothetical protein CH373_11305 [Leptospira perolatii]|uniref:Lcl C-terminal domain-containing protein n=1 Tax=Leptospira perolatii TaxID=2023191 RepID=A0A2M9ZM44_9LEPT|nr:DUF1566 domain-containing protein [Leptospira perolatii]PJZ69710.1 hypothetical protein CH360_08930 [Leptospira perolatii]PJZ73075.1 hypothetical protein CH373_11305 [Leptospira perolatii]